MSAKASALKDEIERLHREKEDLKKKVVRSIPRDDAICTPEVTVLFRLKLGMLSP